MDRLSDTARAPTAAALVIGDEILSGKVSEANVQVLARSLRDERDRLAARLREVERELDALSGKLDVGEPGTAGLDALSGFRVGARADRPPRPSRRRVYRDTA